MTYIPGAAAVTDVATLAAALNRKADASALTALSTTVSKKADASDLAALAGTVPSVATTTPLPEATQPAAGSQALGVSSAGHQHPRLTSTTYGTIGVTGTTTITFTRSFASQPGVVMTEVGGSGAQPAVFKVDSWIQTSGAYIGCVVRGWRAQVMPTLTPVNGLLTAVITGINTLAAALSQFNVFAAPATGTVFSCVAIQRSDVT